MTKNALETTTTRISLAPDAQKQIVLTSGPTGLEIRLATPSLNKSVWFTSETILEDRQMDQLFFLIFGVVNQCWEDAKQQALLAEYEAKQ